MTATACRCCGSVVRTIVMRTLDVPVENSRLFPDERSAHDVPTGDLVLARCEDCGFVQNDAFDASLIRYDAEYEDSQAYSPFFLEFAERIIDELIGRYRLRGRRVLEIGCGRGDFLRMYCDRSGGSGIGVDPSATREAGVVDEVEIRVDEFRPGSGHEDADVVICRHTLEHVPAVAEFLSTIRRAFDDRPGTILYLEVPDAGRIADEGAFWDVYYEHCGYFDLETLSGLLRRTGWTPLECRLDYGGQYLVAHARPSVPERVVERHTPVVDWTPINVEIERWREWGSGLDDSGARPAVWAATSKTVGFMSLVPDFHPLVAVDINPAKWGRYLPSSGIGVGSPPVLVDHGVDTVLVMNPLYMEEIRAELDRHAIAARLVPCLSIRAPDR